MSQHSNTIKGKPARLFGALPVLAVMVMAATSPAAAQSKSPELNDGSAITVEGSWIATVQIGGTSVTTLMSLARGGVALATGALVRQPPTPSSLLYGSWKATGRNSAVVTLYFFTLDLSGNPLAMMRGNITLQTTVPNRLAGNGALFQCDLKGANCLDLKSPFQIAGERIVAQGVNPEPLPVEPQ